MKYIVDFKNNVPDDAILSYLNQHGCTVLQNWSNFDKVYLVESNQSPPVTDIIEFILEDEPLKIKPLDLTPYQYWGTHKDPDAEKITVEVNEQKDWWKNYSYVTPEFDNETLLLSRLGQGINVYVMDSGIDKNHPEFSEANITDLYSVIPGDFQDRRGHGTAIASVIVGKTCGITSANVKNVKIFEPGHNTLQSEMLSALDAILEDHDNSTFAVLNCSWAIDKNPWVEYKLKQLIDEGVWVLASAGNNGRSIEDVTPASMVEVLTVGAYSQDLKPCDFSNFTGESIISFTSDSNNHGELDGWAPGENIWCAGLNNSYGYTAGTSIATGILSAIVASNASHWLYNNNKMNGSDHWRLSSINPEATAHLAFARVDLLDLAEEKYQNSKNLVATIVDRSSIFITLPPDEFIAVHRVGMQQMSNFIFEPSVTSKIEEVDPLPPFMKILPIGNLYASPTQEDGPQNGDPYKLYNSTLKRTNNQTNEEELIKIKIYVLAENTTPDQIPNDHEIKITLNAFCSGPAFMTCGPLFTTGASCIDRCAGGGCCYQGKGTYQCICGFFSDIRLKSNIVKIGTHKLGIGLYEYDVMGTRQTGVMAHELIKVMPEAVQQDINGYYRVCYSMID